MAGPNDFTGLNIQDSYQRVLQISSSGQITDGTGSVVNLNSDAVVSASHALTASYAISASHEITFELSSSYAQTASVAVSASHALTASYAISASHALTASYAISASHALTASYAISASHAETADSVPYSGLTGTVPTWNQNTTGNAATATTATTASNATTIGPIASDAENRFLTSDGDGTLTAEANLSINDSGNIVLSDGEIVGSGSRTGFQTSGFISGSTIIAENHITASGNISSSGIIYAEHLYSSDDAEITDDLSLGGNLNLADNSKIVSTNTNSTYIKLNNDDYWIIFANNVDSARFTSAGVVFNEGAAASSDFRVETANDDHAFNIDSGLNAIELGRAATTNVTASGNISAAGNISSSGYIYGSRYYINQELGLTYHAASSTYRLFNIDDSNIGIGAYANQNSRINLWGAVTASGNISSSGKIIADSFVVNTNTKGIDFMASNGTLFNNISTNSADDFIVQNLKNSENLRLRAGQSANKGKVLIQQGGTATSIAEFGPTDSIHLSGSVTASGNISASGYIYAGGDIHAVGDVVASSTTPSDYRLKENIRPIERPLEKILNLDGKEFDWKKSGDPDFGLIAQDVEKIIPKLVKEKNILGAEETQKVVNYISIIPLLIESIKELNDKIEEIKNG